MNIASWHSSSHDLDQGKNVLWSYLKCVKLCLRLQNLDFFFLSLKQNQQYQSKKCLLFTTTELTS